MTRPSPRFFVGMTLMSDEDLVRSAQQGVLGAMEALVRRYRPRVEAVADHFFLFGADKEDVIQEGMIGLFRAIGGFRSDNSACFQAFADKCIRRKIQSAVRAAGRQKHRALNLALPEVVAHRESEDQSVRFEWSASTRSSSSEDLLCALPEVKLRLTDFENSVLEGYLAGQTYLEMSRSLGCPSKAVDNGLQRAKRKIMELLSN